MRHPVIVYRPIIPGKPGKDDVPLPGFLTDEPPESSDGALVVATEAGTIRPGDVAGLVVEVQFVPEVDDLLRNGGSRKPEAAMKIAVALEQRIAARATARDKGWNAF